MNMIVQIADDSCYLFFICVRYVCVCVCVRNSDNVMVLHELSDIR